MRTVLIDADARSADDRTAPHRTAPHRIASHRIAPHRTASHRTASGAIGVPDDFANYLRELFADLGPIDLRPMFGGHGLYLDGTILGIVLDETLYLKTDEATRARFEAAGSAPCEYQMKGRTLKMSYWSVPAEAMDSPQAMRPWAQLALDAALRKRSSSRRNGRGKRR
jgi:DNA transformation protein